MISFSLVAALLAVNVTGIDILCDFSSEAPLEENAVLMCVAQSSTDRSIYAICPLNVNGVPYGWHPISGNYENGDGVYVSGTSHLEESSLSRMLVSEYKNKLWHFEVHGSNVILYINVPEDEHFVMKDNRLLFICAPSTFKLTSSLNYHLTRKIDITKSIRIPWRDGSGLTEALKPFGKGIGMLYLRRSNFQQPLQGCGSRSSSLFLDKQLVDVDADTGVRSCEVDPMSSTPIGFLCEGRMEPPECMKYLIDTNGKIRPNRTERWTLMNRSTLVVAQPLTYLATSLFEGHCLCIDPLTDRVLAKIVVKPRYEYVCDINNMLMKNRVQPIHSFWCSVTLHPGSTLTIRFPPDPNIILSDTTNTSTLQAVYPYETQFKPSTLEHVSFLTGRKWFNSLRMVDYNTKLSGDALSMDTSSAHKGVIKIKYHRDKPLAMIGEYEPLCFYWQLLPHRNNVFGKIITPIKVALAVTHPYDIKGCDSHQTPIFDPSLVAKDCVWKKYEYINGFLHKCVLENAYGAIKAGIFCKDGESLMPNNCLENLYDYSLGKTTRLPQSVKSLTYAKVSGMRILQLSYNNTRPLSVGCSCVDSQGYDRSQLILQSNVQHMLVLPIIPIPELNGDMTMKLYNLGKLTISDARSPGGSHNIDIIGQYEKIVVARGTSYSLECRYSYQNSSHLQQIIDSEEIPDELKTSWIPKKSESTYLYKYITTSADRLIKRNYKDVITGSSKVISVTHKQSNDSPALLTFSYRSSGILISKDPNNANSLSFHYLCGLRPDVGYGLVDRISEVDRERLNITDLRYPSGTYKLLEMVVVTTDPYVHGCGVTFTGEEIFKPDTVHITDANDGSSGCQVDLSEHRECGFYCPPPYVIDPPLCFQEVLVDGVVTQLSDISDSMVYHKSTHFSLLSLHHSHKQSNQEPKMSPPLQCRCLSITGEVISTINIVNYYSNDSFKRPKGLMRVYRHILDELFGQ
uniref:Uncharacterized protein n=2 Tax=Babesia bovis TaxID=5865 RepID=A7AT18_BABBO|nr:hypothetical protein [Babesia bovis]|eukprot:XP_001609647.1 hypothetical protein [Babesia bovis T2Bo]